MKNSMEKKNPAAVALGKIKSEKKSESSRENGLDQRPHIVKTDHFLSIYPHKLLCTEFTVKLPLGTRTPTGRPETYNPDFYCPTTGYFIEVSTSKPNISEQRLKWAAVLALKYPLKVFWWEGEEITKQFI